MSSGFVSGGTTEEASERDRQWEAARRELEAERQRKAEEGKQAGGKSLYEILQQNKAAKQEAFEESIRLKNQFRALDEDEVEFLDSLLESTRAKEAALKKETAEQLEIFHRQRQEAERAALDGGGANNKARTGAGPLTDEEQWSVAGRKRRRAKEREAFPGVKLRKSSSSEAKEKSPGEKPGDLDSSASKELKHHIESPASGTSHGGQDPEQQDPAPTVSPVNNASATRPPASSSLGLSAYDSDED
ncbi:hypothetical protein VTO42DRAFT_4168 [Malbranchea cinnamomea]